MEILHHCRTLKASTASSFVYRISSIPSVWQQPQYPLCWRPLPSCWLHSPEIPLPSFTFSLPTLSDYRLSNCEQILIGKDTIVSIDSFTLNRDHEFCYGLLLLIWWPWPHMCYVHDLRQHWLLPGIAASIGECVKYIAYTGAFRLIEVKEQWWDKSFDVLSNSWKCKDHELMVSESIRQVNETSLSSIATIHTSVGERTCNWWLRWHWVSNNR